MFKNLLSVSCILGTLILSACGLETYQSGDLPTSTRLNTIKKGQTKEQVMQTLGAPVFSDDSENILVYGKIRKKSQAFMDPKEFERDVYVFYFNNAGVLTEKKHLTLADAKDISYDTATTKTQQREMSVTEQLVNNFGRYDAGGRDSTTRQ